MTPLRHSAFRKYFLLELPGWILAASVLTALVIWEALSRSVAVGLFALWVAKDFALYPLLRAAYEDSSRDGTHSLIGALGTAKDRLDPDGYVRVGSELWHARIDRDAEPVEPGAAVRVREVELLTLRVEAA
jgi:membrane protein implicated in regulation of membrane protease activity